MGNCAPSEPKKPSLEELMKETEKRITALYDDPNKIKTIELSIATVLGKLLVNHQITDEEFIDIATCSIVTKRHMNEYKLKHKP